MWIARLVGLGGAILIGLAQSSPAAERPTLQDIVESWKQTQERIRSARFEWTTKRWMKQGAIAPAGTFPLNSETPVPQQDVTLAYKQTLIFRDGLVRYESEGPVWDNEQKRFVERAQLYAWDGKAATRLHADDEKPYAFIYGVNQQLTQNEVRPIQFAFRMFHPDWYTFDRAQYEITAQSEMVGELSCIRIETARKLLREKAARGRRQLKAVFWVCPEREFSVVRYAAVDDASGAETLGFELRHELDAETKLWVPVEWTITNCGRAGEPQETAMSVVEEYAINPIVQDGVFGIELPEDTMVTDVRTGEDYIARRGGEKRIVTRAELLRGATRQDLMQTESGQAALWSTGHHELFTSPVTYLWGTVFLLILLTTFFAVRRAWTGSA